MLLVDDSALLQIQSQTLESLRHLVLEVYAKWCTLVFMTPKTERLNIRLTQAQNTVLRRAAEARGESASEYVLRNAVNAAEMDLADRRIFVVDDQVWSELQESLSSPLPMPAPMASLLAEPTVLDSRHS